MPIMTPASSSSRPGRRVIASPKSSEERMPENDPEALLRRSEEGDRVALARLLSLVERGGASAQRAAALAYRRGDQARTVGITGPPGAGKSTLVDRLITAARNAGLHQVGVLAVDPSSPFSGGAILGDRVRMQGHALDEGVFIRSMASKGHLGGLALAVPESIRLLGAAGIPLVLVETVGVGQVEVEVAAATDTTVVVLTPKWGDAVQANKAGLLETADVFVINKADMPGSRETRRDLEQMLDLSAPSEWRPPVVETVASTGDAIDELWDAIQRHQRFLDEHGALERKRAQRLNREFRLVLAARLGKEVDRLCAEEPLADVARAVAERRLDPYEAAERFLDQLGFEPGRPGDAGSKNPAGRAERSHRGRRLSS
jgi:LAO/AO transport system kinase